MPSVRRRHPGLPAILILLPFLLTACDADGASEPSRSAPANPEELIEPVAAGAIAGDWHGLMSCAGRDFPTQLRINPGQDDTFELIWTVEAALGKRRYVSPDGRTEIKARNLVGELDAMTGQLPAQEPSPQTPGRP
ncbi:MAG: hypothetical protein AAGI15_16325, partial [Pseudomonadota bacterium]